MNKYQHIEYNGKTLTVNENPHPVKSGGFSGQYDYEVDLKNWGTSCKTIDIAEGQEKQIYNYAWLLWASKDETPKPLNHKDFEQALESGILIDPARVRFERLCSVCGVEFGKACQRAKDCALDERILGEYPGILELAYFIHEETEKEEENESELWKEIEDIIHEDSEDGFFLTLNALDIIKSKFKITRK